MIKLQKKIVVDEHGAPKEAIIPWKQFCEIAEALGYDLDEPARAVCAPRAAIYAGASPKLFFLSQKSTCSNREIVFPAKMSLTVAMKKNAVVIDMEIMGGEPCFAGTRVPVRALLDYIEGGETPDEFLAQYPTVTRAQAVAFLEEAGVLRERLEDTAVLRAIQSCEKSPVIGRKKVFRRF